MQNSKISAKGVQVYYGDNHAIKDVDVEIADKTVTAFIGPSGCGKTTALRIAAGFEFADSGAVLVAGADITRTPAHKRNMGMVFQSYSLFPNLTVANNVAVNSAGAGILATNTTGTANLFKVPVTLDSRKTQGLSTLKRTPARAARLMTPSSFSFLNRSIADFSEISCLWNLKPSSF